MVGLLMGVIIVIIEGVGYMLILEKLNEINVVFECWLERI